MVSAACRMTWPCISRRETNETRCRGSHPNDPLHRSKSIVVHPLPRFLATWCRRSPASCYRCNTFFCSFSSSLFYSYLQKTLSTMMQPSASEKSGVLVPVNGSVFAGDGSKADIYLAGTGPKDNFYRLQLNRAWVKLHLD